MALGDDGQGGGYSLFLFYFILPLFYFYYFRKGDGGVGGVVYSSGIYLKPILFFSPTFSPSPPVDEGVDLHIFDLFCPERN